MTGGCRWWRTKAAVPAGRSTGPTLINSSRRLLTYFFEARRSHLGEPNNTIYNPLRNGALSLGVQTPGLDSSVRVRSLASYAY